MRTQRNYFIILLLVLVVLPGCIPEPSVSLPPDSTSLPSVAPTSQPTPDGPLTQTPKRPQQLPIHVVYVNHVEVESVLPRTAFPLADETLYTTSAESYAYTRAQLQWEVAQAEAVGGREYPFT